VGRYYLKVANKLVYENLDRLIWPGVVKMLMNFGLKNCENLSINKATVNFSRKAFLLGVNLHCNEVTKPSCCS
jgi:hypothetical protein